MQRLPFPNIDSFRNHPFTWAVVVISLIPFALLHWKGLPALAAWFLPNTLQSLVESMQVWRLWTPTFVHYTGLHLLTNMYLWWLLASRVEEKNRCELLAVFFISAFVANFAQWMLAGPKFGGLSGVVYAFLSYCWASNFFERRERFAVYKSLSIYMLMLIPLLATGWFGKYANISHVVGLLIGIVLAMRQIILRPTKINAFISK